MKIPPSRLPVDLVEEVHCSVPSAWRDLIMGASPCGPACPWETSQLTSCHSLWHSAWPLGADGSFLPTTCYQ